MALADRDLHALLNWWRAAGVTSIEAEAILAAPTPPASKPTPDAPAASRSTPSRSTPPKPAPRPQPPAKPAAQAPAGEARRLAEAAGDLAALEAAIRGFEGCALKAGAKSTVVFDGVRSAPILLIGEAPGRDEDQAGKPFVGRSGQLLDRMLAEIGLSRKTNLLITNVVYWRPPNNRSPDAVEVAACMPFVERTLALVQPKAVLLVGGVAASALLAETDGVLKLRGRKFTIKTSGLTKPVNAMVMLHPAYLLRRPQDKRLAWRDLLAAEAWLNAMGVGP